MINHGHDLPLGRQTELPKLSRSSIYYAAQPVPPAELAIMRQIDELHLNYPFAGSRMVRDLLRADGVLIGRENSAHSDAAMGIEAIYRRPNTSKAAAGYMLFYMR
jgi:putative transposase